MDYFPWSLLPADVRRLILMDPEVYRRMAVTSKSNFELTQSLVVLNSVGQLPITWNEIQKYLPEYISLRGARSVRFSDQLINSKFEWYRKARLNHRINQLERTTYCIHSTKREWAVSENDYHYLDLYNAFNTLRFGCYILTEPLLQYYIYLRRTPCVRALKGYAVDRVRADFRSHVKILLDYVRTLNSTSKEELARRNNWKILLYYLCDITDYEGIDIEDTNTFQIIEGNLGGGNIRNVPNIEQLLLADVDHIDQILERRLYTITGHVVK